MLYVSPSLEVVFYFFQLPVHFFFSENGPTHVSTTQAVGILFSIVVQQTATKRKLVKLV